MSFSGLFFSSSCVFPQSPQRSPWHRPTPTLKWVKTPGCSAPRHMTALWTSPSSGPWMDASLTCTRTVNTTNAPRLDIISIQEKQTSVIIEVKLIALNLPWLLNLSSRLKFIHVKSYLRLGWCLSYFYWSTWHGKVQPSLNDSQINFTFLPWVE